IHFQFNLHQVADTGTGALHRGPHAAGDGDMIVLDQYRVIQPETVVRSAAHPHRVFLRGAQSGHRLAGATDLRLGTHDRIGDATPLRWHRKFSAVRSAVRMPRADPRTVAIRSPGASLAPSGRSTVTSSEGSISRNA